MPASLLSLHDLRIHQETASARLYTPKVLEVPSADGLKVYRTTDHTIRQVLSASALADVVVLSPTSFQVDLYRVATPDNWKRDEAGFLVPEGDPYRSHSFSDGGKPGSGRFEAVESSGASRKQHLYTWEDVAVRIDTVRHFRIEVVEFRGVFPRFHRLLHSKWS